MIKCPACKSTMLYKTGKSEFGNYNYEFYGCSRFPHCRKKVEVEDAYKYDDGKEPPKRTLEQELDDVGSALKKSGYNDEEIEYAKHMWENDK